MTLLGVKGYFLLDESTMRREGPFAMDDAREHVVDRDILILPEVCIERYDEDAEDILGAIYEALWNACGKERP